MSYEKFPDFDAYINASNDFAQPILLYLRSCVHEAFPEIKEEFKWNFPNFMYKGKILCNMAAFKEHVAFGFWLASHMEDHAGILIPTGNSGMGNLGKIKQLSDLPSRKVLIQYIHQAILLTDQGKKLQTKERTSSDKIQTPEILSVRLDENKLAKTTFDKLSPSHKKEYIEWIEEAKTEATRIKRLNQTIEWLEEGKSRNWKYMKRN